MDDFVGAKFSAHMPLPMATSTFTGRRDLGFSSAMLPTPSPYHCH